MASEQRSVVGRSGAPCIRGWPPSVSWTTASHFYKPIQSPQNEVHRRLPLDSLWYQGATLVALLGMSGFFSMSETALVSADRFELRSLAEKGDRRARRLESMLDEPERLLTTILLGNNLVNIAATALATSVALSLFGSYAVAISTGVMTFLILVFAEITPKSIAVRKSLQLALGVSGPLRVVENILWPFVRLFSAIAKGLLLLVGIKTDERTPFVTQAQIEGLVRMGAQEGEVEKFEAHVISEVFDFTETDIHEVMTPVEKVQYLRKDATLREALELSARTGHSRIPVVDEDFDHVLGFVHVKDLLRFTDEELGSEPVTDVLRAVLFVRHDAHSDKVLVRMQREHKVMAIIQNEEGHNVGIATAEDLLEELVGEITDEFDMETAPLREPNRRRRHREQGSPT